MDSSVDWRMVKKHYRKKSGHHWSDRTSGISQAAIEARDQGLTLTSSRRQGGERERRLRGVSNLQERLNLVVNALCF